MEGVHFRPCNVGDCPRLFLGCRRSTKWTCLQSSISRRARVGVQANLSMSCQVSHRCECRSRPFDHPMATQTPYSSSLASPGRLCPTSTTCSRPTPRPSYTSNQKCARAVGAQIIGHAQRDRHSSAAEIHGGQVRLPTHQSPQGLNVAHTVNSLTLGGYSPIEGGISSVVVCPESS